MDQGTIILIILSFLTGLAAGYLSGLLGIGSGVIMVPAAMFILSMDFGEAKALSLFVIMFTAPIGMWRHHTHGNLHARTGLVLGIPGVCGSLLGVYVAGMVDVFYLKILFALVMFFAAYRMIVDQSSKSNGTAQKSESGDGQRTLDDSGNDDAGERDRQRALEGSVNDEPGGGDGQGRWNLPTNGKEAYVRCQRSLPFIGFIGGLAAGLLGIGGGVIMVPSMVFLSYPMHSAVANSLMVVFLNAFAGTAAHTFRGELIIMQSIPMMIGAVLSVRKGADMSVSIDRDLLRKYFGYFMILLGIYMMYRSWID